LLDISAARAVSSRIAFAVTIILLLRQAVAPTAI